MMIFCHPFGAPSIASHCPPIPLQPLVMVYRWCRFGLRKCLWFFFTVFCHCLATSPKNAIFAV